MSVAHEMEGHRHLTREPRVAPDANGHSRRPVALPRLHTQARQAGCPHHHVELMPARIIEEAARANGGIMAPRAAIGRDPVFGVVHADRRYRTPTARQNLPPHGAVGAVVASLVGESHDPCSFVSGPHDEGKLLWVGRQRLLTENVQAGAQGIKNLLDMVGIGTRDTDCVQVAVQQVMVVRADDHRDLRECAPNPLGSLRVGIGKGSYPDPTYGAHPTSVAHAEVAAANDANAQLAHAVA